MSHTSVSGKPTGSTRMPGHLLFAARLAWIGLAAFALVTFGGCLTVYGAQLSHVCSQGACITGSLSPETAQALQRMGVAPGDYAVLLVTLILVSAAGWLLVGLLIFWRKSDEWMALLLALMLVQMGTLSVELTVENLSSPWLIPARLCGFLSEALFFLVFSLFPNGRFGPRWICWLILGYLLTRIPSTFFPGSPLDLNTWSMLLDNLLYFGALACLVGAQIYRFRRISTPPERQQTKWVVFGFSITLVLLIGLFVPDLFLAPNRDLLVLPASSFYPLLSTILFPVLGLLIPLSFGIAILRARLWDIDLLINRALVYSVLTIGVVSLYVLVVAGLGILLQAQGNTLLALLATGLIAVLFHPLHTRLQRAVNRLMYGDRDTPYQAIARLGQRLEATLTSDAVLPTIVETTAQALKLPYAAIRLRQEEVLNTVASFGTTQGSLVHLPLLYQGEQVGELLLAPRAPGEAFSSADRKLLEDLARQAGVAVHTVALTRDLQRLTRDLQRSQTVLVTAREEERRRLRRDLHDGLGSTLAALNWQTGALRSALTRDLLAADALIVEQQEIIRSTIADIRRLVYDLRPPSLDELGLVGALRERVAHVTMPTDVVVDREHVAKLHVTVEATEDLPLLLAAIEVAAYRIVQEALTNVVRHAHATICQVRLSVVEGTLHVEVTDDGVGIATGQRAGVGLLSMQERAAEVGGKCHIQPGPRGGTQVWASLPFPTD